MNGRGIYSENIGAYLTFHQRHIKTAMRALTEFLLHRCIQRRSNVSRKVKLQAEMQSVLLSYEQFCVQHKGSSTATLRVYRRDTTRFLQFLEARNLNSINKIQASTLSEFVMSQAHLKPGSLARIRSSLRSFLRYLCMQGIVSKDLTEQVPKVRLQRDKRIPHVWSSEDIDKLLTEVERHSPIGKRDYVILLLAVRLGMRVSDIRQLKLDHLLWNEARIEMKQKKGCAPLSLPLTKEIGEALIEYLRYGRPNTQYREVFLRANAPIAPFGKDNNLYNIITTYRRRAQIPLPSQGRCGLHSFRHTMASRLLEAQVPLEMISSMMGHLSIETTRIYTKIDSESLRSAAICPEEVFHA